MSEQGQRRGNQSQIRLGFVPLSDCAPIAVAKELGIFERYGLNVVLSRELGWASVRDKMFYGDLDAAQSIAGIAFALGMGFSELRCDVAVPLILNLHGNAITLSSDLKPSEIGKGEGLHSYLTQSWKKDRPFTMAATHRFSSHHILLYQWLRRHGLSSPADVEIIFLPPPLMPRHLKAGHIDGYCVGEPWNSESILAGTGWSPAVSSDLSHGHPEKVLLVSGRFLRERKDESIALAAALLDACKMCQEQGFQNEMISILAMKEYTGASEEVLRNSLAGHFNTGIGTTSSTSFHVFHGDSVNCPTVEKASWVLAGLRSIGILPDVTAGSLSRIYREDLFHAATLCSSGA
ncbi:MAG: ABC transporter substrate-binding protein [Luteolibacter sp.]|uniref:ABC transporter substrate-binding protein n=1 Tax=Luteolibacter sp. TaxID=1962973 RepID=UPI0032653657